MGQVLHGAYFGTPGAGANIDPFIQVYENYLYTHPNGQNPSAPLPVVNVH